jgi:hypothetical protein
VRSSERVRLLVFSLFLGILIIFAIVYSPANAYSRPADQGNATVVATGTHTRSR